MGELSKHYKEVVEPTWDYAKRIHDLDGHWSNAALGLAGEAGEVADTIKKMLHHTVGRDYEEALRKELGDVIYYLLKIVDLAGFTIDEILATNKEKLIVRHEEFFSAKS